MPTLLSKCTPTDKQQLLKLRQGVGEWGHLFQKLVQDVCSSGWKGVILATSSSIPLCTLYAAKKHGNNKRADTLMFTCCDSQCTNVIDRTKEPVVYRGIFRSWGMHLRLPSLHHLMLACCTIECFPENGSVVHVIDPLMSACSHRQC